MNLDDMSFKIESQSVYFYIHNESFATRKAKIKDIMDEVTLQLPLTSTLTWKAIIFEFALEKEW